MVGDRRPACPGRTGGGACPPPPGTNLAFRVSVSSISPDRTNTRRLEKQIREIEDLGDSTFRRFEWDLVAHYRRHEEDQEWIAVALTDKRARTRVPHIRDRVVEILSMLQHVHDPLITGL
jgi:hypothetical protein